MPYRRRDPGTQTTPEMNPKLNFLLRTLLAVAVQDREAFVEKFGRIWEDYTGGDAETGKQKGEHLAESMDNLRAELQLEAAARKMPERDKREILNAIQRLESQIEELGRKMETVRKTEREKP